MIKKNTKFFIGKNPELQTAIDKTGIAKSVIARSGKLSTPILNKALKGLKISSVKAYGIINGINIHRGVNPEVGIEDLFLPE